ncbi:hypothetical protein BCR44DRAFT_1412802 [Catenaria anguillulae PL171]|uniref:L domain-like protein n=1 Tax=Catenaria anguillulae PL171 TaxID=765915 RepID=A0A1Y2HTM5_9FUNG|nr:hypothetical protein BCR44DRAFT_1412802 [Catenaria anguillulae PL171]
MNGDPRASNTNRTSMSFDSSSSSASAGSARRPARGPPAHLKANPNFFAAAAPPDPAPPFSPHRRRPASPDNDTRESSTLSAKSLALTLRAARADGKLNLSNRRLAGPIPPAIWSMYEPPTSATASLDTSANDRWWDAVELTKLLLADNQLTSLDPKLAEVFPALQVLDVHNNHLTNPGLCDAQGLAKLVNLTVLNLAGNRLTEVPQCITVLPNLGTLALNNNSIAGSLALPAGVLPKLTTLDASDNLLGSVSADLSHMQGLITLKLANNRLRVAPAVVPPTLRALDVSGNQIDEFVLNSGASWPLEVLDLRRNKLAALHIPQAGAPTLKELYVSSNRIASLDIPTGSLPKLALLDVRDNQLESVPEEVYTLGAMPDLKRLDLTNNAISVLPPELGFVPLHALNVEGNLVRGVPRSGGTVALLKWLKEKLPPGYKPPSPVKVQQSRARPASLASDPYTPQPTPTRAPASAPAPAGPTPSRAPAPQQVQQQQQQQQPPVDEWITLPSGRRIRRKPSAVAMSPMGLFGNAAEPAVSNKRASTMSMVSQVSDSVQEETRMDATTSATMADGGPILTADMSTYPNLTATTLESLALAHTSNPRSPLRTLTLTRVATLGRFPDLSPLASLTDLSLTHCHLTSLPASLPVPTSLATLDLSHNPLVRLPADGLCNAPHLHTLTLVACQLSGVLSLSVFAQLPSLATLLVANNQLTDVDVGDDAMRTVPRLVCLDLSNNALGKLDPRLANVPGLQVLKVEGNCFRVPRWDVVQRGSAAVLEWCRGRLPRG